ANGRASERQERSWDDLADELALDDSDGARERLMESLPLGQLAKSLGVPRSLLDSALAYDTPDCEVSLSGGDDARVLERYLAGPLRGMPERPRIDAGATVTLYFPTPMAAEAQGIADRLGLPLGTLVWAAWEHAKPAVHAATPGLDQEGNET